MTTPQWSSPHCECAPGYQNVIPFWISGPTPQLGGSEPGDCHIHGMTRDILCWIALILSALGFLYSCWRILFGVPRGGRGFLTSLLAAASLGYSCRGLRKRLAIPQVVESSYGPSSRSGNGSRNTGGAGAGCYGGSGQSSMHYTKSKALTVGEWQLMGARGLPIYVCISEISMCIYFLTAVASPTYLRVRQK